MMIVSIVLFGTLLSSVATVGASATPGVLTNPTSLIDSIREYLSLHFQPIFDNTWHDLNILVFRLAEQLFLRLSIGSARTEIFPTAPWVADVFGGMNSIATHWNSQIFNFFNNISTIVVPKGRSIDDPIATIEQTLNEALTNLLRKLQDFFVVEVEVLLLSLLEKYSSIDLNKAQTAWNDLFSDFRSQVKQIFDTNEKLFFEELDRTIHLAVTMWNDLKDRIIG